MGLQDFWTGNGDADAGITGLEEEFHARLVAMFDAMPDNVAAGVGIKSGNRTYEEQAWLYDQYINHGGNLAAPPGQSNHNHGRAADISFNTEAARQWFHANAANFGLGFPIPSEDWHIEPLGLRDGSYSAGHDENGVGADPEAYEDEIEGPNNSDMKVQLGRVADMLMSGGWASKNQMRQADPAALAKRNLTKTEGDF